MRVTWSGARVWYSSPEGSVVRAEIWTPGSVRFAFVERKGVKSFDDLKNVKVGAIAGSAADEYLRKLGLNVTAFQEDAAEFTGITTGKVDAILEDDVKVLDYLKANKDAPIEIVAGVAVPEELIFKYGYGYARYAVRPADCQLRAAMGLLFRSAKLAVEPAGAAATAALCGPLRERLAGKRVGLIVCGANIDAETFCRHLAGTSLS